MNKILLIALLVSTYNLKGQDGFVRSYDLDKPGAFFSNLTLVEDTVAICGLIFPENPPFLQAFLLLKTDTSGNVLEYSLTIDSAGYNFYLGNTPNGFIHLNDKSGYIITGGLFGPGVGVVIKLDNNGKLVWQKMYSDSLSLVDHYGDVIETEDGFLITGNKQSLDYSNNLFVMKTDKHGNKIWEKAYGENNGRRDSFGSFLKINDNEYVIGGSTGPNQGIPWQQTQTTVKIFAIDSLGNEKWFWESELFLDELWVHGLQKTVDGGWAYATARGEFEFDGYMKRQAKFMIRDSNFNIIEDRLLDDLDIGSTNYLLDLIPSQSGGWIGVGANFEWVTDPFWAEAHVYGWTIRIDETGDTLWARNDLAFPDTAETATTVELHSVVELPSGSIIAAGYYRPFNISGPDLGVLIKVDKDGCLVNCTPLTTTEWFERPKIEISVFPNPADRQISLETPFPLTNGCEWSLYNAVGQQVLYANMSKGTTRLEVPLTGVPSGLYFWEMKDLKGKIGSGKLIVSEQ